MGQSHPVLRYLISSLTSHLWIHLLIRISLRGEFLYAIITSSERDCVYIMSCVHDSVFQAEIQTGMKTKASQRMELLLSSMLPFSIAPTNSSFLRSFSTFHFLLVTPRRCRAVSCHEHNSTTLDKRK